MMNGGRKEPTYIPNYGNYGTTYDEIMNLANMGAKFTSNVVPAQFAAPRTFVPGDYNTVTTSSSMLDDQLIVPRSNPSFSMAPPSSTLGAVSLQVPPSARYVVPTAAAVVAAAAAEKHTSDRDASRAEALAARRQKHNTVEIRRRRKISERMDQLKSLINCSQSDKASILAEAIKTIQSLKAQVKEYERKSLEEPDTKVESSLLIPASNPTAHLSSTGADPHAPLTLASSSSSLSSAAKPSSSPFPPQLPTSSVDYREVFRHAGTPIAVTHINGVFIDCNVAFSQLIGFPREEIIQTNFFNLIHKDDLPVTFNIVNNLLKDDGTSMSTSVSLRKMLTRDGAPVDVRMALSVLKFQDKPHYFVCVCQPFISQSY